MQSWKHALAGATAAVAPDVLLLAFAWRRDWVPESHPAVRLHRFIHSPQGLVVVLVAGWASHIVMDWWSTHRGPGGTSTPPPVRTAVRRLQRAVERF